MGSCSGGLIVLPGIHGPLCCGVFACLARGCLKVEGRLQIQPNQHALAHTLLAGGPDKRGPIAQLNMGEGKTQVILPMLILELANGHNLVRVLQ